MKKRIISIFLAFFLLSSCITGAYAADAKAVKLADALYELGLFYGTGVDREGRPIYSLDRALTRNEAITLLVRFLGKEKEANEGFWNMPFSDVEEWAKPAVGYAFANGLTTGTSAETFDGNLPVTTSQFITFFLRALGYDSTTDFNWERAWEFSDAVGITDGSYNENTPDFTRADAVKICAGALTKEVKGTQTTLLQKLLDSGTITEAQAIDFQSSNLPTLDEMKEEGMTEVSIDYVQKNGKTYQIQRARSKDKLLLYQNELYCPVNLKEYKFRRSGKQETIYACYALSDVMCYAIGHCNMPTHREGYLEGYISTKCGKGDEYPTVSGVQTTEVSGKTTKTSWTISGNGNSYKVITTATKPGMYLQSGIRTIRKDGKCFVNLNELLKFFGHSVRVSYLEKDPDFSQNGFCNLLVCSE